MEGTNANQIWMRQVLQGDTDFESETVTRFANQLISQARTNLPNYLQSRFDAEDVVQSVFQSFFVRHRKKPFDFATANDVWRLLSAMTYRKVCNKIRFHNRHLRDARREGNAEAQHFAASENQATGSAITMMFELFQTILNRIPPKHQEILSLRMNEHTIEEIAEIVQVSTRTVDRALGNIRKICDEIVAEESK